MLVALGDRARRRRDRARACAPGCAAIVAGDRRGAIGWLAQRQIGGQTGDVLGAIEQGGETAMLLAAAAWS